LTPTAAMSVLQAPFMQAGVVMDPVFPSIHGFVAALKNLNQHYNFDNFPIFPKKGRIDAKPAETDAES
jgi:hypothetical protein